MASLDATSELTAVDFSDLFQEAANLGQLASLSGPTGFGPEQFLPTGERLPYTIRFENPETAAAVPSEIRAANPPAIFLPPVQVPA